jgi:hypothetical protein
LHGYHHHGSGGSILQQPGPELIARDAGPQGDHPQGDVHHRHAPGVGLDLGDFGLGKSTLLRYIFARVNCPSRQQRDLHSDTIIPLELRHVAEICSDFEIPPARSELALQESFEKFLVEQFEAGKNMVIFIDETATAETGSTRADAHADEL